MIDKQALRRELKARRRAHVEAIPEMQRALLFRRPPGALVDLIPEGAVISAYHEMPGEVPASRYARWFFEAGHRIALPWFADRAAPMAFREWTNPFVEDLLVPDPFQALQPDADAAELVPQVALVPLLGFTERGERIGYGGGHYDRWLEAHPGTLAIGLAWDCQLVESLPTEPHDIHLAAVITPTRFYGPF
ncbi:5-formyltetrahydrofolate cyclo-ligase [Novosphingobium sp.]|uniref:5-formyltetrahydrofolate cyclo-ligase n=1 Tax=Novosphingobium sp. TaxID=1874826 RepID=UPI0035B47C93